MVEPTPSAQLAQQSSWRAITRLSNSHIELCWDWLIIHLRPADLLVLQQCLEAWQSSDAEAEAYTLWLGVERLSLPATDLVALAQLVATAVAQLPRRVVHWVDHEMRLEPLHNHFHNGPSQQSLN